MVKRVLLATILLLFAGCGFTSTNPGEGVVFSRFGNVDTKCYPPGFYAYNPFTTTVYHVDTKVQAFPVAGAAAATRDLQEIHADMVLNFSIDPTKCHELITKVGDDFKDRIIVPAMQEVLKASTAHFPVEKVIQDRASLKREIVEGLRQRLSPYLITVHDLALTNFAFSKDFARSVEAKQIEEQNVAKEEFIRQQRVKQGEQFLALAEGQAKANRLLQESLKSGPEILQSKALDKWDGKLPIYSGTTVPFVNLKDLRQ